MEITKEYLSQSKVINEGTTCFIMKHESGDVFKIYKSAKDYVEGTKEYDLEEDYILNKLNYIVSMKDEVFLTDLPNEVLLNNGKPVGVKMKYYDNVISLKEFLLNNDVNLEYIKQELLKIVNELISKGIIPTDPHFENFMVTFNDLGDFRINMIDVDDFYVSVYPNGKRDVFYNSEVSTCYRVIDLAFDDLKQNKK